MANQVKLTIKVGDDGSLDVVAKNAKKAAKETDKLGKSTDGLSKKRNNYNKLEKGTAQLGANTTKSFAKQAQTIGSGLVPAYATLAANVFAITAAFGALQRAAAVGQLEEGLKRVGFAAGQNLPYVASEIRDITGAAVSMQQAMESTALAMSAGFSVSQLEDLTRVAKGASLALGRDMGDALTRLVKGTAKLEPEILDELGILVRLDEASQKYADSLGKPVTALTRFEKQQAFLNATIDQGKKKFDLIAESVEANPYDKLAASFADLSKIVLEFVGKVLEPLVTFLAESPGALTAAMLMFGSTIVKQVTPAIGELVAKQRLVAAEAALMANKATKVISEKYKAAQTAVKSLDFSLSPKSVQGLEQAFKSGKVSAEDLKKSITALKISETQRNKQNAKYSGEALTRYKAETEAIVQQRTAMEGLRDAEKQKYTTGAAGAGAQRGAAVSGLTGRGLKEMEKADGVFKKLGVGARYAGLQVKQVGKNFGKLGFTLKAFTLGARAAAGAATLMGSALLNMIPIVGQILFVLSLLAPLIAKLFDKGKAAAAAEEVNESLASTTAITTQLNQKLDETLTKEEEYAAVLKVRAGLMAQVSSGIEKIIAAQKEEDMEGLVDLKEKQIKADERVAEYQKRRYINSRRLARLQQDAANAQQAYNDRLAEGTVVESALAKEMLTAQVVRMSVAGGTEHYAAEITALNDAIAGLGDEGISEDALRKLMETAEEPTKKLNQEVAAVKTNLVEFGNIAARNAAKQKGHGAEYIDAFLAIENSIASAMKEAEKTGETPLFEVTDGDIKKIANMATALGVVIGVTDDLQTTLKNVREEYKKQLDRQIELKEESKRAANIAKELGSLSANNGALKETELKFAKESLTKEQERLQLLLQTTLAENQMNEEAEAVKKVRAQQKTIEEKINATKEDQFIIEKANLNQQKQSLGFTNKILASEQKILDIKTAQAKRTRDNLRATQGVGSSAADELALHRQRVAEETKLNDKGESLRSRQEKAAKEAVRIEFDLLDNQFALEAAKLNRLKIEDKISEDEHTNALASITAAQGLISSARTAATNVVTAEFGEKDQADTDRENALVEQARRESRQLELDFLDLRASRAEAFGDTELAFSLQQEARRERLVDLQLELGKITGDTEADKVAKAKKLLEIEKERLDIAKAIFDRRMASIDKFEGATGSATVATGARNQVQSTARLENIQKLQEEADKFVTDTEKASAEGIAAANALKSANEAHTAASRAELSEQMFAIAEDFRKIGPEGELMGATMEGIGNLNIAMMEFGAAGSSAADKVSAGLAVVGSVLSMVGNMQKASSDARIKAIDGEIAAEQKRDGKSAASVEKIKALEKKKDAAARKAFEQQKKMKMAQTVIATATGALEAYSSAAFLPPPANVIVGGMLAGLVVAMGAKTLSTIASSQYQGGSSSAAGGGTPKGISIGSRGNTVDLAKSQGGAGELGYMRGESGTGGAENFKPAFTGAKYRAEGGNVGLVVGEQGPELFVPQTPGRVVPNDDVGAGGMQNINFSINTVDATGVEDLLTSQRGNIIGMLREASNSYGEPFMEKVNTSIYNTSGGAARYGAN